MKKYFLPILLLTSLHSFSQVLIWGISEKTSTAYGGKYDPNSGISEWKGKLTLTKKDPASIAGTFVLGNKKYDFVSQSLETEAKQTVTQKFSLQTSDNKLSIKASRVNTSEIEFTVSSAGNMATYIFDFLKKTEPKLVKGSPQVIEQMIDSEEMLMLPLLSYRLAAEGLTGNLYPPALPIHRIALSIAQQKGIDMLTIKKDSLVRLSISSSARGSGAGVNCTGRMPGTTAQECWGQCGPFWNGQCICWDWACGDCCCHQACKEHDLACKCNNYGLCYGFAFTALICGPACNNPGAMPSCGCPSGQFYCSHTGGCLANGAQCRPNCGPAQTYCERLGRCVTKGQCKPVSCTNASCRDDQVCYQGQCYYF